MAKEKRKSILKSLLEKVTKLLHRQTSVESQQTQTLNAIRELTATNQMMLEERLMQMDFVTSVAHNCRNSILIIDSAADTLMQSMQSVDSKSTDLEQLKLILKQSQRLNHIMTQFINSSEAISGAVILNKKLVNLKVLVEVVISYQKLHAERKSQTISFEYDDRCFIQADEERIREIIANLISNAIKYSETGKSILVEVRRLEDLVQISVRDDGQGLNEYDLSNLFKRYQTLSAKPTGNEHSSGLGLAIVKRLTEMHSGKVWAKSEGPGKGATFIVELPYHEHSVSYLMN